jgi:hypothetical protein
VQVTAGPGSQGETGAQGSQGETGAHGIQGEPGVFLDWLSDGDATAAAQHQIDTGPTGLVVRAGTEPALQVLGTGSTGAEGDVFPWKSATVGGNMFVLNSLSAGEALTVTGVDVLSEIANKQDSLNGSSVVPCPA